jgi:DNA-binding transcriptional ArsR family regulator
VISVACGATANLSHPPHPARQWRCTFNLKVDQCRSRCHARGMSSDLDTVFAALADPTRRRILSMLLEDDMAVTDVAEPFEISLAAISKHLAILAGAGLISQEKRGRVKWCKLEPDALKAASVWMQGFGQFEPVNLDAFERFLARELAEDQEPEKPPSVQGEM